jgi:steroid delta-isomerase-like uncharacterized protein
MSTGTEFVKQWMDAFNRGDLEGLVAMCHPDVELSNPNGTFRGAEGIRATFKPVLDASSDRNVLITNVIECGDTVVAEFVVRGTHDGPLASPDGPPVPATGKTRNLPSIGIYDLRDGKLAASRGEYDRMTLALQLGLLGAPASA